VFVEISAKAERYLDARLTRRFVEIELSDADVPPRPGERRPTTYFRVLAISADTLRIELWDKGDYYGARSINSNDVKDLVARRVALAASSLVRDMRERRVQEAKEREREQAARAAERAEMNELRRWPAAVLEPRALGALVPSHLWLAGPGLGGQMRTKQGARLDLGVAWLFGGLLDTAGSPSVRWLELGVTPAHALRLGPKLDLGVGLTAAAASLHATGVRAVDGDPGQRDTWSARAALGLTLEPHLGARGRLSVGPQLGVVLRRVPIRDEDGAAQRVGGPWLGVSAGLALDPAGRL
jgi:hypothetical protein